MKPVDRVIAFANSDRGRALDKLAVRWTGISVIIALFTLLTKSSYNRALLLTTTGRRTGAKRTVVLPYFRIEDKIVVVGSRGGLPTDPMWAHNLRADPRVSVRINRRLRESTAYLAEGEERARLWEQIVAVEKVYVAYQRRAAKYRELPVFVVARIEPGRKWPHIAGATGQPGTASTPSSS